ncbi:MAG: Formamidopyrimidine-DNA glycosylase [Alphaproteobacteria bacterium MarineAlpha5_Bin9]|nr:MAG: Formamidopyrimidine-DNA glycosylase [Alphaproteobacteria bacterium MarineAlpha5_Bin9]|tara:strand:+ start:20365 stop:21204 length:840 start_codon:yes stop_codon:yes gene_type:complete
MPELPEVQTTVNALKLIEKSKIIKIRIILRKLRNLIPVNISRKIRNTSVLEVYRIAKYIIISLDNKNSLIIHLGMSGRLKIKKLKEYKKQKHDHVLIFFKKNILIFNDPRRFGIFDYDLTFSLSKNKYFHKIGLDPFDKSLTSVNFHRKCKISKRSIKQILLDQRIISGIGNIYASEILFDAKISPFILGNQLNISDVSNLLISIRKILNKAIKLGGSSLRDYVSVDGTLGNFQNYFKVYGKQGKKINGCTILKTIQHGRSTFYCPDLQNNINYSSNLD